MSGWTNVHEWGLDLHIDIKPEHIYLHAEIWMVHDNALQHLAHFPGEFCECAVPYFTASSQLKTSLSCCFTAFGWLLSRVRAVHAISAKATSSDRLSERGGKSAHTQARHTVNQGSLRVCVCRFGGWGWTPVLQLQPILRGPLQSNT